MDDQIEIPSYFLCPISMQLMKDPVTVSTGITYDRQSIEKWLAISSRNKVCPVTKQELVVSSDGCAAADLTPNHTLRRLIQSWCTMNASNGIERIPTPKPPVTKSQILKLIKEAKNNHYLHKIGSIAGEGSQSDKKCLVSAGTVEFLANSDFFENNALVEDALNILYHLVVDVSDAAEKLFIAADGNGKFTESLMRILECGNYRSRAYAVILLNSIFYMQLNNNNNKVTVKFECFIEIVRILRDQISEQATKAALKLLINLCGPLVRNRIKAVKSGAVWVLIQLLLEVTDKRSNELILTVLDQLCRCAEGRAELLNHAAGLAVVSKKIFRVSHGASERSVRIISSISKYSASPRVLQEMLQVGVVAKLCLVLQMDGNQKVVERSKQILNLHSRVWKDSPCIPIPLLSFYP